MFRYFTAHPTREKEYVPLLGDLMHSYNNTVHSVTGKRPAETTDGREVWGKVYNLDKKKKPRETKHYPVDAYVRLLGTKRVFDKGFDPKWSEEIYRIQEVDTTQRRVLYKVRDLLNETIPGTFYRNEIQRVAKPVRFLVNKYIKSRVRGRRKQYLVSWLGMYV